MTRDKDLIEVHHVSMAIQALGVFCKKYDVELAQPNIVDISIALRERDTYEWTPCGKGFRRIQFLAGYQAVQDGKIALVFGYAGFDQALTEEFHKLLDRFTKGALFKAKEQPA